MKVSFQIISFPGFNVALSIFHRIFTWSGRNLMTFKVKAWNPFSTTMFQKVKHFQPGYLSSPLWCMMKATRVSMEKKKKTVITALQLFSAQVKRGSRNGLRLPDSMVNYCSYLATIYFFLGEKIKHKSLRIFHTWATICILFPLPLLTPLLYWLLILHLH